MEIFPKVFRAVEALLFSTVRTLPALSCFVRKKNRGLIASDWFLARIVRTNCQTSENLCICACK